MKTHLERHRDICELWNEVSGYLKVVELSTGYAFIPAINELRYSARKLLDVWMICHENSKLSPEQSEYVDEQLIVAEQYLENAHHDISDEIVNNIRYSIGVWAERCGPEVFKSVTVKRKAVLSLLSDAEAMVAQSREDREKRKELYVKIRDEIAPEAIKQYFELEDSLIENAANNLASENALRSMRMKSNISLGFGAICAGSVIVAVISQFI